MLLILVKTQFLSVKDDEKTLKIDLVMRIHQNKMPNIMSSTLINEILKKSISHFLVSSSELIFMIKSKPSPKGKFCLK